MMRRRLFTLSALLALTACSARGGGGGGLPSPDDAGATDARPAGDSTTTPPTDTGTTPPGNACPALCARIAATPGCVAMAQCLSLCAMQNSIVPAACRGAYDTLITCASTSPVACEGSSVRFAACMTQQATLETCVAGAPRDAGATDVPMSSGDLFAPCTTETGPGRNCGWTPGRALPCPPGQMVVIGCTDGMGTGAMCSAPLGACSGDPVMRVCAGTAPCTSSAALASNDDACDTCPVVTITCPSSGSVYVMTGPYSAMMPATCTPALRPATDG